MGLVSDGDGLILAVSWTNLEKKATLWFAAILAIMSIVYYENSKFEPNKNSNNLCY